MFAAAPVWHYWIAGALFLFAVVPVTAMVVIGYLNKVVKPKYPGADQERA